MSHQENFFTKELCQYYLEKGENLSEQVIQILNKSPLDLTAEERETYQKTILPTRQNIKQTLEERLGATEETRNEWEEQLHIFSQSIIGQIASELFLERETPSETSDSTEMIPLSDAEIEITNQETPRPAVGGRRRNTKKLLIIVGGISLAVICVVLLIVFLVVVLPGEPKVDVRDGTIYVCKYCKEKVREDIQEMEVKESEQGNYGIKQISVLCGKCEEEGSNILTQLNNIYEEAKRINDLTNAEKDNYVYHDGTPEAMISAIHNHVNSCSPLFDQLNSLNIGIFPFRDMASSLHDYMYNNNGYWTSYSSFVLNLYMLNLYAVEQFMNDPSSQAYLDNAATASTDFVRQRTAFLQEGFSFK